MPLDSSLALLRPRLRGIPTRTAVAQQLRSQSSQQSPRSRPPAGPAFGGFLKATGRALASPSALTSTWLCRVCQRRGLLTARYTLGYIRSSWNRIDSRMARCRLRQASRRRCCPSAVQEGARTCHFFPSRARARDPSPSATALVDPSYVIDQIISARLLLPSSPCCWPATRSSKLRRKVIARLRGNHLVASTRRQCSF